MKKRRFNSYYNNNLLNEVANITYDLGSVIFIGAVAIFLHIDGGLGRESRDLDCSIAYDITDEELLRKQYRRQPDGKNGYFTPRGEKLDIYRGDVNGISSSTITQTAEEFEIGSKNNKVTVAAAGLEVLIVMKKRTGRPHDIEDLRLLIREKYKKINLGCLRKITSDIEFKEIEMAIKTYIDLVS
jgi:hypothetical protein